MEPPTTVPRRATTLTRLWRSTDAADSIAQFLPTEALPLLPNIAKTFERDHWRLLGALMRRAKRGTAAACKSAVLSTLQMGGRDTVHLREDWADQARFDEKWTVYRRRRGGGEPEHVEYTARVSQGTLVLDRTIAPKFDNLASRFDIPESAIGAASIDFALRLRILRTTKMIGSYGSGFLANLRNADELRKRSLVYLLSTSPFTDGSFQLRWRWRQCTHAQNRAHPTHLPR